MSVDATIWAWQQELKGSDKLLLLTLADRAGEDHTCWPSYQRISADTGLHRNTISAAIKRIVEAGLITKLKRYGNSTVYQLNGVVDRHSSTKKRTTTSSTKTMTDSSTKTRTDSSTDSSTLTYQRTSQVTSHLKNMVNGDVDATLDRLGFNVFWDYYPKKKAKKEAIKAFLKLAPSQTLLSTICANLAERHQAGEDPEFYPNPATYLNGERWTDQVTQRRSSNAANQRNSKPRVNFNSEGSHDWRDPDNTRGPDSRPLLQPIN